MHTTLLGLFLLFSLSLLSLVAGGVVKLTDDNVDDQLSHGDWLILFYDGSKHKAEKAEWKALGSHVKEAHANFLVGIVDCAKYPDTCYDRKLKKKDLPKKYLLQSADSSFTPFTASTPSDILSNASYIINGDVVVLTKDNFEQVRNGDKWLIEFYAPWCGHCKQLIPTWKQLATEAKKKNFHVAKIDAATENEIAKEFDVTGFPTIKLVHGDQVFTHDGPRTVKGFTDFVANPPPPKVEEEVEIEYYDELEEEEEVKKEETQEKEAEKKEEKKAEEKTEL